MACRHGPSPAGVLELVDPRGAVVAAGDRGRALLSLQRDPAEGVEGEFTRGQPCNIGQELVDAVRGQQEVLDLFDDRNAFSCTLVVHNICPSRSRRASFGGGNVARTGLTGRMPCSPILAHGRTSHDGCWRGRASDLTHERRPAPRGEGRADVLLVRVGTGEPALTSGGSPAARRDLARLVSADGQRVERFACCDGGATRTTKLARLVCSRWADLVTLAFFRCPCSCRCFSLRSYRSRCPSRTCHPVLQRVGPPVGLRCSGWAWATRGISAWRRVKRSAGGPPFPPPRQETGPPAWPRPQPMRRGWHRRPPRPSSNGVPFRPGLPGLLRFGVCPSFRRDRSWPRRGAAMAGYSGPGQAPRQHHARLGAGQRHGWSWL